MKRKIFVEVKGPVSSTIREATVGEISYAETIRARLRRLRAQKAAIEAAINDAVAVCPHLVSIDTPGYLYATRSCYACGKDQGIV